MAASPMPKTIHGASTIRSIPVIPSSLTCQCCHYQWTRWSCGPREADMVTVWRRATSRAGAAACLAGWRDLTEAEHAAAVGELRELAAGRADLLAEVAGMFLTSPLPLSGLLGLPRRSGNWTL
jgi:hypothetical protein